MENYVYNQRKIYLPFEIDDGNEIKGNLFSHKFFRFYCHATKELRSDINWLNSFHFTIYLFCFIRLVSFPSQQMELICCDKIYALFTKNIELFHSITD
jgi:hypothetical protein